jgi:hypothetical protein
MEAHINTYDRTYLWRILHDHVYMQKLKANDFVKLVIKHLNNECQPHVTPFILQKAVQIIGFKLEGS